MIAHTPKTYFQSLVLYLIWILAVPSLLQNLPNRRYKIGENKLSLTTLLSLVL